ncbi:MAG TPA: glutaredoxin family protein [Pseudomonadales bacterium]|nr:glutaredoxin family protein [Pseudomonadales bacterium]
MLFALLCLVTSVASTADVYKWRDASGKLHFSDQKPGQDSFETLKTEKDRHRTQADSTLPVLPVTSSAATQPESTEPSGPVSSPITAKKKVVMYSASWCGYCKQARQFFKSNDIPFKEYDVENSAKGKRDYEKMQGKGVPIILVDKRKMQGFNSEEFWSLYSAN